ncbi:hypothetical protein [Qipengyuania citrea]|uniref:hypothetical protein n=1 Tax=Qipengyuania citrea TaxID=225971 RepID=UPI003296DE8B
MAKENKTEKPGTNAALVVIGLTLAALANTLVLPAPGQLVLGIGAVGMLLWAFVRLSRKQN